MAIDARVQIPPDSTGKGVRTREVRVLLPDATYGTVVATVEAQVVSISDDQGRPIDLNLAGVLSAILQELRDMHLAMKLKGW